ncbi:hypothetical protein CJ467_16350 [Bacillus velezensis]|uniref:hypothetical protein n=1 Tax=Bacillus velezensis TaxID=492670 RepID=UPI000BA7CD3C|nr:hypothetical protein [Bacillus velezensis]MEC2240169.1 hypothetical protein [Bacillus velezensis]MED3676844.1 hypothetical protein [Bacillus velezensis]PAK29084.1 hypothetical protein CJ467_16350 [Bacillus velezensis]
MSVVKGLTHCTFRPLKKCTVQPLGVMPNWLHNERRAEDLKAAINRYIDANCEIPAEWIEEYNLLISSLRAEGVNE